MNDFWLAVGLLLLVALNFVLIPVLFVRCTQNKEDRTALNVVLYQERVNELQREQECGALSVAQKDSVLADAARKLLADTEEVTPERFSVRGKSLPLLIAFLVPVLGLALYLRLGASDKVELAREFALPFGSPAQMTSRLERAVNAQPESAESAYFLAKNYMAQGRPGDAAKMFERAVSLSGRRPELLGEWAKALYFSNNKKWSAKIGALTDEALAGEPGELVSLSLLGLAAFEGQRYPDALKYWNQALMKMRPNDVSRTALVEGIRQAKKGILEVKKITTFIDKDALGVPPTLLQVRVDITPEIIKKVDLEDSVFVFIQTLSGSGVPLAAKRLKVSDLPLEVEFSDADMMIPSNTLSQATSIQVTARISKNGKPTSGEWLGRSSMTIDSTALRLSLTIDRPDI